MKIEINLKIIFVFLLFVLLNNIDTYIIFLIFIIIHEISHLTIAILIGAVPKKISINPFGVSLELYSYEKKDFWGRLLFFGIGPFTNFIIALISMILRFDNRIIYINLAILCFNILPILPLDGGRILREILNRLIGNNRSTEFTLLVSKIFLCVFTYLYSIFIVLIKNVYILFLIVYLWYLYLQEENKYNLIKLLSKKKNCGKILW